MPTGKVKFFNEQKGFGFIEPEDGGTDAFVHVSAVEAAGMNTLKEGDRLTYELEESKNGKMAATNLVAA
jgi:CspA family cold shock protein